jgi:hypothetical protein
LLIKSVFIGLKASKQCLCQQGSNDKICTASHTCIHVLSLCHLYPLLFTWRITNEKFQKILFSCNLSHNFTPKSNELRLQLLFITIVFHRALASCCSRKIE